MIRDELIAKFEARDAHIAVIGLGYVGLPLCVAFAKAGYKVTGIDVDSRKVEAINSGESYIEDIPSEELALFVETGVAESSLAAMDAGIGDTVAELLQRQPVSYQPSTSTSRGSISATTDYAVLSQCDAVSICVPTPLNKTGEPDVSYIVDATEQIATYIHRGMVIVLESTTYPGTTSEVALPILQKGFEQKYQDNDLATVPKKESDYRDIFHESGIGKDFFLAFSPERIDPGREDWTVETMPKVMGGMTAGCLAAASAYYGQAVGTLVPVSSPDAAEMVKLFENTFRSVNIGLANELLLMCDKLGLDAWEILEAAETKPFGFMKFTPGPGLGGHCIPVDPHYLSWKLRTLKYTARFIDLASEVNMDMPAYWVQKTQDALNDIGKAVKNSTVLVLGVAYKKNVSDLRESPALDIIHLLQAKGALVEYHDPYVPSFAYDELEMACVHDLDVALAKADCVLIATDHSDYDWHHVSEQANILVDTRHVVPRS